jgi:ComF family protein
MVCGRIIAGEKYDFCEKCFLELPRATGKKEYYFGRRDNPRFVDLSAAPFFYKGGLRTAVIRYKFKGKRGYSQPFARYMYESYRRALSSVENASEFMPHYITWVPISKKRMKKRGYDQSRLLAEELGTYFNVPVVCLLEKTVDNAPQSELDFSSRRGNVLGVYKLKDYPVKLKGKPVLIVDDVYTTGATISEAAKTLLALMPSKISALFIAKTDNTYDNAKKRLKITSQ